MVEVNEQLDALWANNISGELRVNAEGLKKGLVEMEKGHGVENAGVHQVDNSVDPEQSW